eukprot:Protomagalhaensia_sp_Gyna_25__1916@NODE_2016_length_1344_cov_8_101916_g1662_i0_p1_GENE_NODE_2016_length_1344_cov_8_101916_g1662_i0NODE_2016_length_1344_cov_8_101916_g1662_i0_p1_ORF_typecomplete_len402_score66_87DNA_methylase/PF00145_17/1_7e47Methyltransf_15/PF09445_10/0_0083UPF0020/PF01170_18/0_011Calcipressin/PF04847_12/0_013Calcipressin/PF04847_12/9e03_NODE_2016_length_1344_cov_8_101916_g1662_i0791284
MPTIRVADFFCGIGGNSVAAGSLCLDDIAFEFAHGFDVSDACLRVYKANFKKAVSHHRSMEHLKLMDLEKLKCEAWLLSPPCQPFTVGGKQLAEKDPRNAAFKHWMSLMKELKALPKFIFIENVPNFASSETRNQLVELLTSKEYKVEEYQISPVQVGFPNSRSRYYVLAWLRPKPRENLLLDSDENAPAEPNTLIKELPDTSFTDLFGEQKQIPVKPIGHFLEYYEDSDLGWKDTHQDTKPTPLYSGPTFKLSELVVPSSRIERLAGIKFEIATATTTITSTFTGGYGQLLAKSGPVLELERIVPGEAELSNLEPATKLRRLEEDSSTQEERFRVVDSRTQAVRHFSPTEVLRLHGFPKDFVIPVGLNCKKLWGLLGNSVNVQVVMVLLHHLFTAHPDLI